MRVHEVGEFSLIARLRQRIQGKDSPQLLRGIGDDCAVLRPAVGQDLLVTTDTQEEGVHFRRDWATPEDIGWRCLAVNVSDIAAMGGVPMGAVVALSLPASLEVAFVEGLYDGMQAVAERYDCPIIGGNISQRADTLAVTITVLGAVPCGQSVYRSGAQVGDEIWVTGTLGGAKAGLEALLHPEAMTGIRTTAALARYRRPCPRLHEAQYLRQHAPLHSLIDLSDGLSSDLRHICTASGVGARLEAACLPIGHDVLQVAAALRRDALEFALHGGEDFELCLTVPAGRMDAVSQEFPRQFGCALTRLGTIQADREIILGLENGTTIPLPARGYDHFRSRVP
jgi:thiamine-monophosphate kinase